MDLSSVSGAQNTRFLSFTSSFSSDAPSPSLSMHHSNVSGAQNTRFLSFTSSFSSDAPSPRCSAVGTRQC
jgi:hypothetical protein